MAAYIFAPVVSLKQGYDPLLLFKKMLGGYINERIDYSAKIEKGDKVATVSLSWGGSGDDEIRWRYEQGVRQLQDELELEVVEMPHTLSGTEYIYNHPQSRAKDLMDAFLDSSIKGIITCIGGIESVRILPYIDFNIIRQNPKVFIGYSDTTVSHMICFKAGIQSYYGPTILVDFAENNGMDRYTVEYLKKALFCEEPIGEIIPAKEWTSDFCRGELKISISAGNANPIPILS